MSQVVKEPTRDNAILDLVITNLNKLYERPVVCSPMGYSDHNTVFWSPCNAIIRTEQRTEKRTIRPLVKLHEFGMWITSHTWDEVLNAPTPQEKADVFYSTVHDAINRHFPCKVVKFHTSDKPWITPEIKNLMKKRQSAFADKNMSLWRSLRNKVARLIDKAKKSYYRDRIQNLKTCDPAKWHKGIQLITNKKQQSSMISAPGIPQHDEKAIAEAINQGFASVSQSRPQLNHSDLPAFLPSKPPPQVQVWDMYDKLKKINVRKSPGPDDLPSKLVKEFACEISIPVTDIFNASLREGRVPQVWKDANIAPIPKENPATISKLRPISLTPILAKVCEEFVSQWALDDMSHAIDRHQYGSIKGSSTTHCLIELLDVFYRGTDKCNTVGCLVVTDFSKAFDCVDHTLAIQSLCELGVRSEIIPWIADFLTARRQRVKYQSAISEWQTLTCGVPQGTKFGPITFIAMINSAAAGAKTHTFKYVDDLSFAEVRQANQPTKIEMDVQDLDGWSNSNFLKLNPSKCKVMQICFKSKDPPPAPSLKIGGKELEVVTETKLLGLNVQSNLSWESQVDSMVSKGSRRLYMLNRLKRFGLPVEDLVSVYVSYVRPVVEYATPVWHGNLTEQQSARLESIQKRACRIILGRSYDSYTEALKVTGLHMLSSRRSQLCTNFAIDCTQSDRYSEWFPLNGKTHSMKLRQTNTYHQIRYRTERYGKSSIPFLGRLLNNN